MAAACACCVTCVGVVLCWPQGNTALHMASRAGFIPTVQVRPYHDVIHIIPAHVP